MFSLSIFMPGREQPLGLMYRTAEKARELAIIMDNSTDPLLMVTEGGGLTKCDRSGPVVAIHDDFGRQFMLFDRPIAIILTDVAAEQGMQVELALMTARAQAEANKQAKRDPVLAGPQIVDPRAPPPLQFGPR